MLGVADPSNNSIFEVHQYFDRDFTGTHGECISADIEVVPLTAFTDWARQNRKGRFLGEFGVGSNQVCLDALDRVLKFLADNSDVRIGFTYWPVGARTTIRILSRLMARTTRRCRSWRNISTPAAQAESQR